MNASVFQFGQTLPEYSVPVLNERAVRAAAGIGFLFAFIVFMNALLLGNYQPMKIFVIAFLIDFTVRVLINPQYAPTMIMGQWMVRKQQPEYVGAPQKRFAWALGMAMALTMFYLVVFLSMKGTVNLVICCICLALMFAETAFGICVGCMLYNALSKEKAQLCPGGVCEMPPPPGAGGNWKHGLTLLLFLAFVAALIVLLPNTGMHPAA